MDVEVFWSAAIRDLLEGYCLHRVDPCDGGLWAFAHHVHDALFDYDMYGRAAVLEDEIIARTVGFVGHVYKLVLGRSDAEKASRGKFEAAQLTPHERGIQECEITHGLQVLGFDLSDSARRSRILDALIASADEIRFYPFPEEEADEDEDVGRKSIHRGAAQAAAQNVGRILPDLRAPRGVGGLTANYPLGERTVMARKAAAKRRDLRGPSPTWLIEAAADSVLRDELRGDLFVEAMEEIADVVDRKFEEQRRIDEEREG